MSIIYLILALLGISFLIFIHELGHYFMAKRVGIIIEAFSIGFGKPIVEWERNGVKWRICWIPLGGYVRQRGLEKKGTEDPHEVEGGYFAAKPWARIKFLVAGPIVNILFALIAFSIIWFAGGRDKPFSEFTNYIGWVDKDSKIYEAGIRPGDEILKVNGKPYHRFEELLYAAMLDDKALTLSGEAIDYASGGTKPFTYVFQSEGKSGEEKAALALQSLRPAAYLLFDRFSSEESPMKSAGIEKGDRILWLDGNLLFSRAQMIQTINSHTVFLTVNRNGEVFHTRVPRIRIEDLRLSSEEKGELDDWRTEAKLTGKAGQLYYIPYNLTATAVVEGPIEYLDAEANIRLPLAAPDRAPSEVPLLKGDKIMAVQGELITSSYDLLSKVQTKKSLMVVKRSRHGKLATSADADKDFVSSFDPDSLRTITSTIGTSALDTHAGDLYLLKAVTPVPFYQLHLTGVWEKQREERVQAGQEKIEGIDDDAQKALAQRRLEAYQSRLMLGIGMQDKKVRYNPNPFALFGEVVESTGKTLYAVFTGYLKAKHLSGPVGMVQMVQHGWSQGFLDAMYWLGLVSLSLGILNLLPLLPLDGGHVVIAIVEWIRQKPLSMKTIERLYIPSAVLFIGFFIYIIYHDLARLFTRFF